METDSDTVTLAQALVRLPSVNPEYDQQSKGEGDVGRFLLSWASSNGFETDSQEVFPGRENITITLRNGTGRHLLFNAHLDTVGIRGMMISPFEGEVRDGRLYGRGSVDMKGPLACMLSALVVLRNSRDNWSGLITLLGTVDEEVGFSGIRHFVKSNSGFDFSVTGEPTGLQVVRGCKGCLRFYVRAHGKAAHSSTPHLGVSAIHGMAQGIIAMNAFFTDTLASVRHVDLGFSTGSVGLVSGGSGINIVPEFCEVRVDIRLVPGQDWKVTYDAFKEAVVASTSAVRWEFQDPPMVDPPYCLEAQHPLVEKICEILGEERSGTVNFSCDTSKIAEGGVPCIILGPGECHMMHAEIESISVGDLQRGTAAYVSVAKCLLSSEPNKGSNWRVSENEVALPHL